MSVLTVIFMLFYLLISLPVTLNHVMRDVTGNSIIEVLLTTHLIARAMFMTDKRLQEISSLPYK